MEPNLGFFECWLPFTHFGMMWFAHALRGGSPTLNASSSRFNGQLKKWNADRGFGFVVAEHGDQEIFVHVSAFARDGRVPTVGEALSFEIELDKDGRKRAVRVRRPGAERHTATHRDRQMPHSRRSPSSGSDGSAWVTRFIGLLIAAGLGWYAYAQYGDRVAAAQSSHQELIVAPAPVAVQPTPSAFQCDGRQHCSEMTSCREAKLFLKNCPGMKMDGDGDGIPCEQQLCTGPFGG